MSTNLTIWETITCMLFAADCNIQRGSLHIFLPFLLVKIIFIAQIELYHDFILTFSFWVPQKISLKTTKITYYKSLFSLKSACNLEHSHLESAGLNFKHGKKNIAEHRLAENDMTNRQRIAGDIFSGLSGSLRFFKNWNARRLERFQIKECCVSKFSKRNESSPSW